MTDAYNTLLHTTFQENSLVSLRSLPSHFCTTVRISFLIYMSPRSIYVHKNIVLFDYLPLRT